MREKLVSKTYMSGVLDYEMVIINSKDKNYSICIKKINDISEPFDIFEFGKNITHIDNGYYIVEATLFDDYYNARVYLDDKMNIIDYYFDISRNNGVRDFIPFYDDLYLDVLYYPNENNLVRYDDMDELLEALEKKNITKEEYDLAIKTGERLTKELEDGTNFFINIDFKELVSKYFG